MKTGERAVLELDCRFSQEVANNPTNNPPLYLAPPLTQPPSLSLNPPSLSIKSPLYINMLLLYTVLVCVMILSLLQLIVIICIADFMSN